MEIDYKEVSNTYPTEFFEIALQQLPKMLEMFEIGVKNGISRMYHCSGNKYTL